MVTDIFKDNWSKYFLKNNAACVINGKTAIHRALELLESRVVAIPTYTCHRIYEATINAKCKPIIVDCDYDLQIKIEELAKYDDIDTVIVPHMFGITALEEMKLIKKMGYKIIEDCSQCMGLADLGRYSDIVIASLGPTKWLPVGVDKEKGGAVIAYDGEDIEWYDNATLIHRSNVMFMEIEERISRRTERIDELRNAGLRFIGQERPNAWLRAMYYTENQKRVPYTPLHDIYEGFKCPLMDSIKNKIDWVSVFPN
tara:strand:+ start:2072 stop:2839 length:768 start_codon:yes stop_codon:yes gene_type:complete